MKKKNIRQYILLLCGIALLASVSSRYFFRIDLTAEKRYTLSAETKQLLRRQEAPLHFNIYLSGDIPAGFRKLRNAIREMLDDFKSYGANRISYRFIDPSEAANVEDREKHYENLEKIGLRPTEINIKSKDGSLSQQIVFPGAAVSYKGRLSAVNLLRNNREQSGDANLNASMEMLEYELIKTFSHLSNDSIEKIAFITGHGELSRSEIYDLGHEFANYYDVDIKTIGGNLTATDPYKAIIIAKPQKAFDEKDKFIIDRYIMRGGRVMWLIDAVNVDADSLFANGITFALASELNLEDQLFTYGIRINPYLVQDIINSGIPVTTSEGTSGSATLAPWLYYPLLAAPTDGHVITKNLNPVWMRFAGDIDTIGANSGIRKTVLLQSSEFSRVRAVPAMISLDEVERPLQREQFNKPYRIAAVLSEGRFPSVFRSRNARHLFPDLREKQPEVSVETKMLTVADGDIARNDVRHTVEGEVPYPLGLDVYTKRTFGNKEFLTNALEYLTDDIGLTKLRNREFRLRLLDKQKVADNLLTLQIVNLGIPVVLIICGGLIYTGWRRRRYGHVIGS